LDSRKSSVTAEGIEGYKDLIKNATDDLEDHLQNINEKLEAILERTVTGSSTDTTDTTDLQLIKEERKSAQKCLQICAQLSNHINQIKPTLERSGSSPGRTNPDAVPEKLTFEGLQECQKNLVATTAKLENHMKDRIDQLVIKMKTTAASEEEIADVTRLRQEWDTARQCIDICSKANTHLAENVTTVDNYGTGDNIQLVVSTDGKVVHGKNRGHGWRNRQAGGHMNDTSLQELLKSFSSTNFQNMGSENRPPRANSPPIPDDEVDNVPGSEFKGYGRGYKLASKTSADTSKPSTAAAEGKLSSSWKE
jgi:hypothetical protein